MELLRTSSTKLRTVQSFGRERQELLDEEVQDDDAESRASDAPLLDDESGLQARRREKISERGSRTCVFRIVNYRPEQLMFTKGVW